MPTHSDFVVADRLPPHPDSESGESRSIYTSLLIALAGLFVLYVPTFTDLFRGVWSTDAQAHGPIVFGLSLWLLYRGRETLLAPVALNPKPAIAYLLIAIAGLFYALGRSQGILLFEVGSLVWMLIGVVLLLYGPVQVKSIWFALFFMLFMIPLPGAFVDAITHPMKMAVSYVAEQLLYWADYPVSRNGVIIQIGPYQLLVADACAGLHTLFTLEALGLLYLNIVRHASVFRNVTLAVLIIPISFAANVIRVVVLTLITFYFGDDAGQGFMHGFAGMVLFMAALFLIIGFDSLLRALATTPDAPKAEVCSQ